MYSPLINYYRKLEPLSPTFISLIQNGAEFIKTDRSFNLTSFYKGRKGIIFIVEGILRKYVIDDGKEITISICSRNETIGIVSSLSVFEGNKNEFIEALEPSNLIIIPNELIKELYRTCPESNILARKILSISCRKLTEESTLARIPSGLRRYSLFTLSNLYTENIKAKLLASYLSMREETLSRIKRKLNN